MSFSIIDSPSAVELLEPALPYDLATAVRETLFFPGNLYSVYARGLAYLAARQGREAAGEFQMGCPILPLGDALSREHWKSRVSSA
jgi:hypothetical protein